MRQFGDSQKRNWTLDLTVGCVRRVKGSLGIDLAQPEATVDEDGKLAEGQVTLAQRLVSNVMLAVDVIFACVAEQAEKQSISVEQFAESLKPEICKLAREAFLAEWEDFFRQLGRPDQAGIVRAAIDLETQIQAKKDSGSKKLMGALSNRLNREADAEIEKLLAELNKEPTSGSSSTNLPESSESTPSPLPSDD